MANKKVDIDIRERLGVQTGTIPVGVTAAGSKYPVNSSDTSIDNPNYYLGPTQTPSIPVSTISRSFDITLSGDWTKKIKPLDQVQLSRGNIKNDYSVKKIVYYPLGLSSHISLTNNREAVQLLDAFIGTTGYPSVSPFTTVSLDRKIESPNDDKSLVNSLTTKLIQSSDNFSVLVEWDIDPSVKATRLRWRSSPRNISVSSLSFYFASTGEYSSMPNYTIESETGRRAEILLKSSLIGVTVSSSGSGYTIFNTNIEAVGGGGTGASFSFSLSGDAITDIQVTNGGSGYTSVPSIAIHGGYDAIASVTTVLVDGLSIIQQGGNYLSPPSVIIDSTYQVGNTASSIVSSVILANESRLDYIRVTDQGYGYTGASVTITGSLYPGNDATAEAQIVDGRIVDIKLLTTGYGYDYGANVIITPSGTGGTGASAIANSDIFSSWVYENPVYLEKSKVINNLKYNIPYEIEILASTDENFRGINNYI